MSKMIKTIAALGVVAGLGVAALPMSSYAAQKEVPITAIVDTSLSISVSADAVNFDSVVLNGPVATKSITVSVASNGTSGNNKAYNLTLEDYDSNTNLSKNGTNGLPVTGANNQIPAGQPTQGQTFWGYSVDNTGTWAGVVARGDANVPTIATGNTTTTGAADDTIVTFGVSAGTNLSAGTYTGSVLFTATATNS